MSRGLCQLSYWPLKVKQAVMFTPNMRRCQDAAGASLVLQVERMKLMAE